MSNASTAAAKRTLDNVEKVVGSLRVQISAMDEEEGKDAESIMGEVDGAFFHVIEPIMRYLKIEGNAGARALQAIATELLQSDAEHWVIGQAVRCIIDHLEIDQPAEDGRPEMMVKAMEFAKAYGGHRHESPIEHAKRTMDELLGSTPMMQASPPDTPAHDAMAEIDPAVGYREALERVKEELGVPGSDYPAPVMRAWDIADAALRGHRFADGDEQHSSRHQHDHGSVDPGRSMTFRTFTAVYDGFQLRDASGREWRDISCEMDRRYEYVGSDDEVHVVRIVEPQFVCTNSSKAGGHLIIDHAEVSHYIQPGWVRLRWSTREGAPHFVF